MEEVSFNSHGTEFVIVNGQAVILQKDSTNICDINEEIFQSALNDVNSSNQPKDIDCLQDALTASTNISNLNENGYVIVGGGGKSNNSKMIQLSLEQASELGLEFSVSDGTGKEKKQEGNCENILGSEYFYQEPIQQTSGICEINGNNGVNVETPLDLNSYNDLLQLPMTSDNLSQQITLVPQYIDGNLTYTLQFGENVNNFEFPQSTVIGNSSSLSVPTLSISNQDACIEKPESNVKCTSVSPNTLVTNSEVSSVQDKIVTNSVVGCQSDNALALGLTSLEKDQVNTYPVSNRLMTLNTKPRILTNTKPNQRVALPSLQKIVDSSKLLNSKIQVSNTSKGQSLLISNQRKLTPMKMPLPPLNSNNDKKKRLILSSGQKSAGCTNLNFLKPVETENNVLKRQLVTVSTKPRSLTKLNEHPLTTKVPSISGVNQAPQKSLNTVPVSKFQTSDVLSSQKPLDANLNGIKPARRLTQSQLKQIASVIQKNRNNQAGFSTPSTLYDTETNTRIICRVVYPEDFAGRVDNRVSLTKKRGRPSKCKGQINEAVCEKKPINEERKKQALSRTRSGRLSRPPRHMVKDYKRLQGDDSDDAYSDYVSEAEDNSENSSAVHLLPGLSLRQKRNISSEFRCPTCNKIYLGHVRMRWHFTKYPDHGNEKHLQTLAINIPEIDGTLVEGPNNTKSTNLCRRGLGWGRGRGKMKRVHSDSNIKEILKNFKESEVVEHAGETVARALSSWDLLLLRINAIRNGKSQIATLCDELRNIVQQIRLVAENIFQPTILRNDLGETLELEDDVLSNVFGIPKGTYLINDFSLDSMTFKAKECTKTEDNDSNTIDRKRCKMEHLQNSSAELLEENRCETSFLLNSEILCDKSFSNVDKAGIDSVDQIVNERLKTMTPVDDIMPSLSALPDTNRSLDSSDDLMAGLLTPVESISTQSLADSIMFTSPNESRLASRTEVSASTEDLMKSLENLSREINGGVSDTGTTDIDFSVLSQDFASGR